MESDGNTKTCYTDGNALSYSVRVWDILGYVGYFGYVGYMCDVLQDLGSAMQESMARSRSFESFALGRELKA